MQLPTGHALETTRRRCKAALDSHRRRAKADRQELDYGLAELLALVEAAERCCYCGTWLMPATFAFDHAVPTCRRADYALGNLLVCCGKCNLAKGLLSADEFRRMLAVLDGFHPRARADVLLRLRAGGRRYG